MYLIIMYNLPKRTLENFSLFFDSLMPQTCMYDSKFIIIGDFNIPQ